MNENLNGQPDGTNMDPQSCVTDLENVFGKIRSFRKNIDRGIYGNFGEWTIGALHQELTSIEMTLESFRDDHTEAIEKLVSEASQRESVEAQIGNIEAEVDAALKWQIEKNARRQLQEEKVDEAAEKVRELTRDLASAEHELTLQERIAKTPYPKKILDEQE